MMRGYVRFGAWEFFEDDDGSLRVLLNGGYGG